MLTKIRISWKFKTTTTTKTINKITIQKLSTNLNKFINLPKEKNEKNMQII